MTFFPDVELTTSDFESIKWKEGIDASKDKSCLSYKKLFVDEAEKAEANNDQTAHASWILLAQVCNLFLNPNNLETPLGIMMQMDGQRTVDIADFEDKHLSVLEELLNDVTDPVFKARLGDLLWIRLKDYKSALKSVDGYLESTNVVDPPFRLQNIKRASQLATSLGSKSPAFVQVATFINDLLDDDATNSNMAMSLIDILFTMRAIDENKHLPLAEQHANQAENEESWFSANNHWTLISKIYRSIGDIEAETEARIKSAEAFVSEAENASEDSRNIAAKASIHEAIALYREIGGEVAKERVQELQKILHKYQTLSVAEMNYVYIQTDASQTQKINEIREESANHVKDKDFIEAILSLAFVALPPSLNSIKDEVLHNRVSFPISHLINQYQVDAEGKTKGVRQGVNPSDELVEEKIRPFALKTARIHRESIMLCAIQPALHQLRQDHLVTLVSDLDGIVKGNPFIPNDRTQLFSRGLMAGLKGDYVLSLHILVPQLENSLRHLLRLLGAVPSGYSENGIQQDFTLGKILFIDELKSILGEDLVFDLQGLLVEPLGSNLRNIIAHGLAGEEEMNQFQYIYLWWLILHLCCSIKLQTIQHQSENTHADKAEDS